MLDLKCMNAIKFKTSSGNQYVFDNEKGLVMYCSDEMYYVISNFFKLDMNAIIDDLMERYELSQDDSQKMYENIKILILEKGHFYKKGLPEVYSELRINDIYETSNSQLLLTITEDCNLRCKYCIYSDNYEKTISYSDHVMSLEVALKSVDYFINLHNERVRRGLKSPPAICFYGGEPFLQFSLIKKVVEVSKTKYKGISFYITTNGTIMTDEMAEFIVDHDIHITFSLDGNKDNHDRNRVFKNYNGTFDIVLRNITKLQNLRKARKVEQVLLFNCCYDDYTDIERVIEFFESNEELFKPYNIIYSPIYRYDTTYYDNNENSDSKLKDDNFNKTFINIQKKFYEILLNGKIKPASMIGFFMPLFILKCRSMGEHNFSNLGCVPGSKISVDPNGIFHICERTCQECVIGNIETGLDMEKINGLREQFFDIVENNCYTCPVSRLCSICYMQLYSKDNELKFNKEFCRDSRTSIINSLTSIYSLLEKNPNALDFKINEINFEFYEVNS